MTTICDTHILVEALAGRLKARETAIVSRDAWSISAISLWELATLAQLGRVEIDLESADVVRALARIHVWPITLEISRQSTNLDFRGDPADELIAATALVHHAPLVTRDREIRKSRIVPLAR